MKRLTDDQLQLSPSDLNAFLACEHLTTLQLAVARGEIPKPWRHNPHADLIRRKGEEWEAAYLARLLEQGREIVQPADAAETEAALLRRAPTSSSRPSSPTAGGWGRRTSSSGSPTGATRSSTRSSRGTRGPRTCSSSASTPSRSRASPGALPARCTSSPAPASARAFRPEDFAAYYRRVRERFRAVVEDGRTTTYPYPVQHCGLCEFLSGARSSGSTTTT